MKTTGRRRTEYPMKDFLTLTVLAAILLAFVLFPVDRASAASKPTGVSFGPNSLGCCPGNVNVTGIVDLADLSCLVSYLTGGGYTLPCPQAANVNGAGIVDLADLSVLVSYLTGGYALPACPLGTVTDIDGNVYQTVTIGTQVWMAENLRVTHYRNGDSLPNVTDNPTWEALTTGACCEYNNDVNNVTTYGRLYSWAAVTDIRSIAPEGWHVPGDTEWQTLADFLGGDTLAGGKLKEGGTTHWLNPNIGATNETGFSALPGGYRNHDGTYDRMNVAGLFWTSTQWGVGSDYAFYWDLYEGSLWIYRMSHYKRDGYSVRCVRDAVPAVITTAISEITTSTAQCGGTITSTGGAPITARGVCWSTDSVPTVADSRTNDGTGAGSYSSTLSGLTDNTTIFVRAYAANSAGTGYGNIISFHTADSTGTVTDQDGYNYLTIKIGTQWWMEENLKVTHYRNGDPIPNVTDGPTWGSLTTGAYCEYNNDVNSVDIYGRLYNWYAVADNRGIAPAGWHVASDSEWQTLVDFSGGYAVAGGRLKEAGTTHWLPPNAGATNETGFSALPGGYRSILTGPFANVGITAYFWSSTELGSGGVAAWYRWLGYASSNVYHLYDYTGLGFSVRCVKDN